MYANLSNELVLQWLNLIVLKCDAVVTDDGLESRPQKSERDSETILEVIS